MFSAGTNLQFDKLTALSKAEGRLYPSLVEQASLPVQSGKRAKPGVATRMSDLPYKNIGARKPCPLYIRMFILYICKGNLADRSFAPWAKKLVCSMVVGKVPLASVSSNPPKADPV